MSSLDAVMERAAGLADSNESDAEVRHARAELDDLRKEHDALSLAFCDMNDGCVRLEKEIATLRAHSAALRTLVKRHPQWWVVLNGRDHRACAGCLRGVFGGEFDPIGCNHAADCWAAPIITLEGMVAEEAPGVPARLTKCEQGEP
jgi:hypothetical protein